MHSKNNKDLGDNKSDLPVVLQVLPALDTGGVERGAVDVAIALKQQGGEPLVASAGGYYERSLKRHGIRHIKMPLKAKNPLSLFFNYLRLKKIIAVYKVQIVHARSRAPAWSAYYAAKHTNVKFITTFHGTYNFSNRIKKFYNAIMVKGLKVVAVSKHITDHIQKHYDVSKKRIVTICRGVDLNIFNAEGVTQGRLDAVTKEMALPVDKAIVLLPGRITRWKGHMVLLDAINKIDNKDFICLFVGPISTKNKVYYEEILKKAEGYGVTNRIYVYESCSDMPALYKVSDVVVSASTDPEAFGRVMAEAGAMGRPVVASNHGGAVEIIQHDKTGWLFEAGNAESLARYLEQALLYPVTKKKTMSRAAIKHIRTNFANDIMLDKVLELYRSVHKKK